MNQKKRKLSVHAKIFIGMALGLLVGLYLNTVNTEVWYTDIKWWLDLVGKTMFIGGLKMLIAPLIFATIVAGLVSLPSMKEFSRIGGRTIAFYIVTTTLAVVTGLVMVLLIQPGQKQSAQNMRAEFSRQYDDWRIEYASTYSGDVNSVAFENDFRSYISERRGEQLSSQHSGKWQKITGSVQTSIRDKFKKQIVEPVLQPPFQSLAHNKTLGIIFFAMILGLACVAVGREAEPVGKFFIAFNEVMMKIVWWFMEFAPYAIFCLITVLLADFGQNALKAVGWYCVTVVAGIAIHMIVLNLIVARFGGRSPFEFMTSIKNAWVVAFSTTSSVATLPVTMNCVNENLKVDKKVSNFVLPLGATINMDGTALYEGVAIIFLVQMLGGLPGAEIALDFSTILVVFITAVLASVGAAAVPSAGLVTMVLVAMAVGLDVHYLGIVFAIDHVLDMFRTSTNITGDSAGAVVVDRLLKNQSA